MNKKAEQQLMDDLGNKPNPGQGNKTPDGKAAPSAEGGHGEPPKPAESATEGHAAETTNAPPTEAPGGENPKPDPEKTSESHVEAAPAPATEATKASAPEAHEPPITEEKPAAEAPAEPEKH